MSRASSSRSAAARTSKCYAKTLAMKPDDAAKDCERYIPDLKDWGPDDKLSLLEGEIERAMIELGKLRCDRNRAPQATRCWTPRRAMIV